LRQATPARVPLPYSLGLGAYSTFATDGKGNEAFGSHYNTSADNPDAGCGTGPYVARSTSSGGTFSGCSLGALPVNLNGPLSSGFGASRIAGTYFLAGSTAGNGATTLDGGPGYSVV
jgi:hypothetical protein